MVAVQYEIRAARYFKTCQKITGTRSEMVMGLPITAAMLEGLCFRSLCKEARHNLLRCMFCSNAATCGPKSAGLG